MGEETERAGNGDGENSFGAGTSDELLSEFSGVRAPYLLWASHKPVLAFLEQHWSLFQFTRQRRMLKAGY